MLRLSGLRTKDDTIEVSVRYPKSRVIPGVVVHRSVDLGSRDITTVDGIPATSVARALCDVGLYFPESEVQRLADHAVATGLVTERGLIDLRRRLGEHGRNGVVHLDSAIDGLPAGAGETGSGPEVALLRLLATFGLPEPVRQHQVNVGQRRYFVDIVYPEHRLALEYDGVDHHSRVDQFVNDRRRQNDLVDAGWTILRFTHSDLRDRPGMVIAQIRRALAHARPGSMTS